MLRFCPVVAGLFFTKSLKLRVQVADLRLAIQRAEQQQARKEDYLREEISELQQVTDAEGAPPSQLTSIRNNGNHNLEKHSF